MGGQGQDSRDTHGLPVVMTVDEAAAFLRISRTSVYELVRQDRLPHVSVGKQIRFLRDRMLGWLAEGGAKQ